jgi:DNA-directed RNA polymerase alpha subunit
MKEQIVCKFSFVCDQTWDGLRVIDGNAKARFCTICESPVYLTESYEELATNVAAKRCVAVRAESATDDPLSPVSPGDSMYMGDVAPPRRNSSGIDPIFGRAVGELELSKGIEEKLRNYGIELIGDLVQFPGQAAVFGGLLTDQEQSEVDEALASRGLTLGMHVENWAEYVEKRKNKLRG